jgi:hypothetical protein
VNEGNYQSLGALNRTEFDALVNSTANAPRCSQLASASCYRSRATLGKAFAAVQAQSTTAAQQTAQVCACSFMHGCVVAWGMDLFVKSQCSFCCCVSSDHWTQSSSAISPGRIVNLTSSHASHATWYC